MRKEGGKIMICKVMCNVNVYSTISVQTGPGPVALAATDLLWSVERLLLTGWVLGQDFCTVKRAVICSELQD